MMEIKTIENRTVVIRKADLNDIDTLIRIHRDNFPYSVSHHILKYYNKKKWSFVITCPFDEIYVISIDNQLVGAAIIVINETEYTKGKNKNTPPRLLQILTIIAFPKLVFSLFKKMINRLSYKIIENTTCQNDDHSVYSNRIWIDSIAISTQHRRQNLAKQLLLFIEQRAIELEKDAICLIVDAKNIHAISLYESQNFNLYKKDTMGVLYYRRLLIDKP